MVAPVVRNDEAVGSIPTSSTKFSITCSLSLTPFCSILFQTFKLAESLPQLIFGLLWSFSTCNLRIQSLILGRRLSSQHMQSGPPHLCFKISSATSSHEPA
jgi:hypothetical protein